MDNIESSTLWNILITGLGVQSDSDNETEEMPMLVQVCSIVQLATDLFEN